MGDNGKLPTSSATYPQLARKYYTVDTSSNDENSDDDGSDSDSSSLLILSPVRKKNINTVKLLIPHAPETVSMRNVDGDLPIHVAAWTGEG